MTSSGDGDARGLSSLGCASAVCAVHAVLELVLFVRDTADETMGKRVPE